MIVAARILNAKLIVRIHVSVDHLGVVVIPLSLNLMAHILLEYIGGFSRLILDGSHHVGT